MRKIFIPLSISMDIKLVILKTLYAGIVEGGQNGHNQMVSNA